MQNIDEKVIEEIIRKIITEKMGITENNAEFEKHVDKSGILSIKLPTVKPDKFDTGVEGDKVLLKDVLTLEESPRLGCGLMEMEETSFAWTLQYDEIDYVIEGRLEIDIDGNKISADAGEIIFIPKGSSIHFTVPKFARFMYVTYPANWADQAK